MIVAAKKNTPSPSPDPSADAVSDGIDSTVNAVMGVYDWFAHHLGITALLLLVIGGGYWLVRSRRRTMATTGQRVPGVMRSVWRFGRFALVDDDRALIGKAPWLTTRTLLLGSFVVALVATVLGFDIPAAVLLVAVVAFAWRRYSPIKADRERAIDQCYDIANTAFRFPKGAELNKAGYIRVAQWKNLVVPEQVVVMYRASSNAADPAKQQSFQQHFDGMAAEGTAWDYQWEPERNRVIITAEPPLPSMAPLPFPSIIDYPWNEFPLGIGVGGKKVVWDPTKVPHVVIAGKSGSGKSVEQRNILLHALQSPQWRLVLIDPKRVELSMYRNASNVLMYAVEDDTMTEALEFALAQMKDRYALMESTGVAHYSRLPDSPHALLVMVDEATSLMKKTGDKDVDELKMRNKAIIGTIAREGRAAGVHIALATQRPDADVLGGDTRSTMEARVAMGGLDDTASRMILGNDMACYTPSQPRGRGVFGDGSTFTRFQSFYFDEAEVPHAVEIASMMATGQVSAEKVAEATRKAAGAGQPQAKKKVRFSVADRLANLGARMYPSDEELEARAERKKEAKAARKAPQGEVTDPAQSERSQRERPQRERPVRSDRSPRPPQVSSPRPQVPVSPVDVPDERDVHSAVEPVEPVVRWTTYGEMAETLDDAERGASLSALLEELDEQ